MNLCLPSTVSEVPALRTSAAFAPHSLKLEEEWGFVLRTAGTYACHLLYEDRIWQTQFPSCCTQNMELLSATSPFVNHQPTTVPVWAQNSSLQTRLHMTFTSENYWGVNLLTYLLTYLHTTITITVDPIRSNHSSIYYTKQKQIKISTKWL